MAGKNHERRNRLLLSLLFITVIFSAVIVILHPRAIDRILGLEDQSPPSDKVLISNFYDHRSDFDQLHGMISEDKGLSLVEQTRTLPKDPKSVGIAISRIQSYRDLLARLGIQGGIVASNDRRRIEFIASFRGSVTHNSQKGYVYTDRSVDAKDLVGELDTLSKTGVGFGMRHIEGNWYLFFEGY